MHKIAKEFKVHCSSIWAITTNPKASKSYGEKYDAAVLKVNQKKEEYALLKNKETKKAESILDVLHRQEKIVKDLEGKKHLPNLSVTTLNFLKDYLKARLYNRKTEFENKYTDKGNKTEEDGITLICDVMGIGFQKKNKKTFSDKYKEGTPDVYKQDDFVIDNKSSFTLNTFPMFATEIPDKKYEWQIIGYADLLRVNKGYVVYTLNNSPIETIESEINKQNYIKQKFKGKELTDQEIYDIIKNHVFTSEEFDKWLTHYENAKRKDFVEIPVKQRVKSYEVEITKEKIDTINQRVVDCRIWLDYLIKQHYGQ